MKKTVKILSIDGGGVRGIIPLFILAEVERRTGKRISEMFHMISGTSTGGIIALLLALPGEDGKSKYTTEEIIKKYHEMAGKIFSNANGKKKISLAGLWRERYDPDSLDEMGKQIFEQTSISEALTDLLITSFELESDKPFFFKRVEARADPYKDFKMIEAARATSAAPSFFKPFITNQPLDPLLKHLAFVDGGIIANNPSLCAYVDCKKIYPQAGDFLVLSLGTGDYTARLLIENKKNWGGISWLTPLLDIFLTGQSDTVDHQLKILLAAKTDPLNHYFRFQPRLMSDEEPVDNATELHFHVLELLAADVIKQNTQRIDELSEKLVTL